MDWLSQWVPNNDCERVVAVLLGAVVSLSGVIGFMFRYQVKLSRAHAADQRLALQIAEKGNLAMLAMLDRHASRRQK